MTDEAGTTRVYRELWTGDFSHRPYTDCLVGDDDPDAERAVQVPYQIFKELFRRADVRDGDEVEVLVRRTGRRPLGERRVRLVAPQTYRIETEAECEARLRGSRESGADS